MTSSSNPTPGTVHLVGAGPGDPGLITVRAVQCLQVADLVLYDYLANPTLVEYAPEGAELVRLGRHDQGRSLTPDEITEVMVQAALEGRNVVRLKGGDASIFARGGDEADACRAAGIPFEIVPGITSGLATAAYAEIPLTHFEDASAVALVTGHERDDKEESHLDYKALAAFPGTLVFYMGVKWAGTVERGSHGTRESPPTPRWPWSNGAAGPVSRPSSAPWRRWWMPSGKRGSGPLPSSWSERSWTTPRPSPGFRSAPCSEPASWLPDRSRPPRNSEGGFASWAPRSSPNRPSGSPSRRTGPR